MRPSPIIAAALLLLAACALPPGLEESLGPEPPGTLYPDLLPFSGILADDTRDPAAEVEAAEAFEARVAALKARAAALKSDP